MDLSFSYNYLYNLILDTDSTLYAGTDSAQVIETGNKLVNRPAHTFKFFLTAFHEGSGLGASFWGDHQSRKLWVPRSNTGGNEGQPDEFAPSRTTLNLNLFKRFHNGLETFVRLENLLGKTKFRYGYWPGFTVFAGFKYDLTVTI